MPRRSSKRKPSPGNSEGILDGDRRQDSKDKFGLSDPAPEETVEDQSKWFFFSFKI